MRYYSYVRCSTQTQMNNNGFDMQKAEIEKYVKEKGIEISGEFEDAGISGTIFERDGLQDLLASLGKDDKIIVQNTSRLWRSDSVKVFTINELKKINADVCSIEQPNYSIYNKDPNDFLVNGMLELLDQYERMTISRKLAKGRKSKAKAGNKPSGQAPLGYKWEDRYITVDYRKKYVVDLIFNKYIELKSLQALADYLESEGILTERYRPYGKKALANILHNDFYIGIVTHNGKKIQGNHEAIIDKDVFDKVQVLLSGKKKE